ncbi:MAG: hypothetical protein KF729_14195 [Sandaracinaceae bacterium]|nr:hypothetical protein [Sandaracinaceae bacterium]
MRRSLAPALLAVYLTAGCEEPAPPPQQAPEERAPVEAPAVQDAPAPPDVPAALPACRLDTPIALAAAWPTARTVALARADDGVRAAVADGTSARVLVLDAAGHAQGAPSEVALAGDLLALEPLPGGDALVLARGSCAEAAHCVLARRALAGEPIAASLPGELTTTRRARTGERLYLAWSAAGGHRGIDMFLVGGGLGRVRRALGPEPADAELPAEVLGLVADGERWAAVHRRGAGEDTRARVWLTTETRHVSVEALHDALVVEAIAFEGARVALVAGFEMSRPQHFLLEPGSAEPLEASPLAPGEVPPRFADRARGTLAIDEAGVHLERADAAGDPLGPRQTVVEGRVRGAALVRDGARFLVAWLDDAGALAARWADCAR